MEVHSKITVIKFYKFGFWKFLSLTTLSSLNIPCSVNFFLYGGILHVEFLTLTHNCFSLFFLVNNVQYKKNSNKKLMRLRKTSKLDNIKFLKIVFVISQATIHARNKKARFWNLCSTKANCFDLFVTLCCWKNDLKQLY